MCLSRDLSQYRNHALLLLRCVVAAIFLYHGTQKWQFWSMAPDGMSQNMLFIMRLLSVAEPLAGIALILGLLTQVAAAGLIVVMISAMWMKISGKQPFGKWEIDLLLFAANIALIVLGPGAFSLDVRTPPKRHWWSLR